MKVSSMPNQWRSMSGIILRTLNCISMKTQTTRLSFSTGSALSGICKNLLSESANKRNWEVTLPATANLNTVRTNPAEQTPAHHFHCNNTEDVSLPAGSADWRGTPLRPAIDQTSLTYADRLLRPTASRSEALNR